MGIPKISKILLISLSVSLASCGGVIGSVKVYSISPSEGLVRRQDKEILPFAKANGFFCESPDDFRDTITCTGGAVKVYVLKPDRGLVRKQANEVLTFLQAKGYLCTSQRDFKVILDECAKPAK